MQHVEVKGRQASVFAGMRLSVRAWIPQVCWLPARHDDNVESGPANMGGVRYDAEGNIIE